MALVILAVILGLTMDKTEKDMAAVLRIAVCCGVLAVTVRYLSPVLDYLWQLVQLADLASSFGPSLLKITGIAVLTEITALIGADAGSASLGKVMHILGNAAVLYLALPLFEGFFAVVQELLGVL